MRIQCSCGATYDFEVTPEMAQQPVQFVCQTCGGDLSESLTELARKELAQSAIPVAQAVESPQSTLGNPRLIPQSALRVRLANAPEPHLAATSPELLTAENVLEEQRCSKHPAELATNKCFICSKPICPKCKVIKRKGVVRIICSNPRHKQRQG